MTTFIQNHQALYWAGILALTLVCCVGWYAFGATRSALATGVHHSPALVIRWKFKPFIHSITFHLWNVVLVARLESSDARVAASLEIKTSSAC